jgi:predicted CXXCH cytochrome family protein
MNPGRTKSLVLFSLFPVAAVLLFLLVSEYAGPDAAAAEKESCVTSKCHSGMGKEKYVHGPVATGECTFCHQPTASHKFKAIKNVGKLCNDCHDKTFTAKVVHPPVKEGECSDCHDPHQSPYRFQLRGEGSDLCFLCHDKDLIRGKFVHGPVAVGGCSICHNPHESDYPKLLMAEGNDVCFSCHSDKEEAFKGKKHIHEPVEEGCIMCHSPHSGDFQYNLPADGKRDLCFTCHDDKEKQIKEVKVKHKGLDTERKCLACHDPHVADYANQLIMQPADLCMTCHDREYLDKNGKVRVANMKAMLEKNKDHHGPIRQKDCSACHNTHGSNNFRMLREYFPELFYAPYQASNYKLCFMCHEKTIAEEKRTTTLTGFRNGDQNLHYVHVNKEVKGRTCRACHDAHATNNPKHIRDAVPFGAWQLPINFEKTKNGGTCLPGCHQLFGYDRQKPLRNR